jgi:hypothetical protein
MTRCYLGFAGAFGTSAERNETPTNVKMILIIPDHFKVGVAKDKGMLCRHTIQPRCPNQIHIQPKYITLPMSRRASRSHRIVPIPTPTNPFLG